MTIIVSDTDRPVWALSDAQLTAEIEDLLRSRSMLEARCAELVQAAGDRDLARLAGATSTATWLKNLAGISRAEAHRLVKRSEVLTEAVEDTHRAWAAGTLNTDQATLICEAITKLPDWVGDPERRVAQGLLLDWAQQYGLDELQQMATRILERIDPDGVDEHLGKQLDAEEKRGWGHTELTMHSAGEAMVRGRFLIPVAQAGILSTVLEGLASPRRNDPAIFDRDGEHSEAANGTLTHNQKLGRAFCELLEHLPTDAMPQHGGLAASVTIAMTLDQLRDGLGAVLLSTGEQMSAAQARRFACNAHLIPMVLEGDSRILDLGMAKRLFNRYQRLALAKRDGGCCWRGCDRPASWCESHHLDHWSNHGPTDIDNGALFCFHHHHLLHNGEWDARMGADGIVEVIPPTRVDPDQKPIRHDRFAHGPAVKRRSAAHPKACGTSDSVI